MEQNCQLNKIYLQRDHVFEPKGSCGLFRLPTKIDCCGILTKKCHVAPSPLATRTAPLATHGIAHSTRIYHIRNSSPPTFHPDVSQPPLYPADVSPSPDIFTSGVFPPDGRGGRFNFPGQTCPDTLVTAYPDSLAR